MPLSSVPEPPPEEKAATCDNISDRRSSDCLRGVRVAMLLVNER